MTYGVQPREHLLDVRVDDPRMWRRRWTTTSERPPGVVSEIGIDGACRRPRTYSRPSTPTGAPRRVGVAVDGRSTTTWSRRSAAGASGTRRSCSASAPRSARGRHSCRDVETTSQSRRRQSTCDHATCAASSASHSVSRRARAAIAGASTRRRLVATRSTAPTQHGIGAIDVDEVDAVVAGQRRRGHRAAQVPAVGRRTRQRCRGRDRRRWPFRGEVRRPPNGAEHADLEAVADARRAGHPRRRRRASECAAVDAEASHEPAP